MALSLYVSASIAPDARAGWTVTSNDVVVMSNVIAIETSVYGLTNMPPDLATLAAMWWIDREASFPDAFVPALIVLSRACPSDAAHIAAEVVGRRGHTALRGVTLAWLARDTATAVRRHDKVVTSLIERLGDYTDNDYLGLLTVAVRVDDVRVRSSLHLLRTDVHAPPYLRELLVDLMTELPYDGLGPFGMATGMSLSQVEAHRDANVCRIRFTVSVHNAGPTVLHVDAGKVLRGSTVRIVGFSASGDSKWPKVWLIRGGDADVLPSLQTGVLQVSSGKTVDMGVIECSLPIGFRGGYANLSLRSRLPGVSESELSTPSCLLTIP